ncbi:ABC transporter ATP-binding protein [Plantibacter flavus]|uniref:ABC transporter ATP-binding protein n=1 Tax=Plantibacter flavus TaxID=150123 RepID=UPI00339A1201
MTSTTPPDPAQQPAPADGTPTSPGTPNTADATGAPAPSTASDDQAAAAPTAPKRAPRSTTPRAAGTAKAPAKRPSTPRTRTTSASETSGEPGDATKPAPKTTTARSTTARTSTAKTTATKSTTARTTAAKRTPAKSAAAAADAPEATASAETSTTPKTPRSTTARSAAAKPATKAAGAKTTTARTSTTKSTTARTPAKRTPARTSVAKQPEQTAAAAAGVLDEVSAPGSVERPTTSTPSEQPSPEVVDRITVEEPRADATQTETPATASSIAEEAVDDTARQATPAPSGSVSVAPPREEAVTPAAAPKRPAGRPAPTPSSAATSSPAATPQRSEADGDGAHPVVLSISGLVKQFGDTVAVDGVDLEVRRGSFYGIVGPNGAGKTTTLSMVTGLLRPDAGSITVQGVDVWQDPAEAKRAIGVLPDRLRLFDRLTGSQLLYYSGVLRGLDPATVKSRTTDLARAFGLDDALGRLVSDYSAGMTKKIALAAALIHSPRVLILDEPFESVDPVSAANVIEILQRYVANGGTVVLSSHGMDFIQRVCDHVAIIVQGKVLAAGSVDEVRGMGTLEERFVELAGGRKSAEGMEWLHSFSD